MQDRIHKLIEWSKSHEGRKLLRFTSVSVIATMTSQLGILVFYGLFHLWGIVASTIAANAVATIPSYYLNRHWTWGKSGRSHVLKEIVPFWTMSALGITASFFGALYAKHVVHQNPTWPHSVDTLIVMFANFLSFAVFWVLKLMLFNRIFHVSELEEVEEHLELEEEQAVLAHEGEEFSP